MIDDIFAGLFAFFGLILFLFGVLGTVNCFWPYDGKKNENDGLYAMFCFLFSMAMIGIVLDAIK